MEKAPPPPVDWARGDTLGLEIPAHCEALQAGGKEFLTRAFRAAGAIARDNSVCSITGFTEISGGSTGRKLQLSVQYEKPATGLHTDLFVKFSRDFDDAHRDAARYQMEREARFALLSRSPEFPIAVPACYFSDFHHDSGTGILITRRVPFGRSGVEPLYPKALDHRMPDPPGHYAAIVTALARLAGTYRAEHAPAFVQQHFPFEPTALSVSRRARLSPAQISERVAAYAEFARHCPAVLPENIRSEQFLSRLAGEAPHFQALEAAARRILLSRPEMIALCHWNAHVDNAWFWRNPRGGLECGLFDWGNVSLMNVAMALWGSLSAAEPVIWNQHLDALLALFVTQFQSAGGTELDLEDLRLHLTVYAGLMGLTWMLEAPRFILAELPNLAQAESRLDPLVLDNERARSQLLILTAFLNLWEQSDMQAVLNHLDRSPG